MNMPPQVQLIDDRLIEDALERARRSPRRRANHNFHSTPAEDPNRFLNAMLAGTYVAPHRHLEVPKPELFLVLRGNVAVFLFDDRGAIEQCFRLSPGMGIDIAPGLWHTLAVTGESAVLLEVKPGFYEAATDKQFARWAPREGEPGAAEYLASLLAHAASSETGSARPTLF